MQPKAGESASLERTDEFIVCFRNRKATPQEILDIMAGCGIEILAHSLNGSITGNVTLLLVTSDSLHTELVLQLLGLRYETEPVVLGRLPQRVGGAALLGMRLAEAGIRIQYSYISLGGTDSSFAVFKTSDDVRAVAACCA